MAAKLNSRRQWICIPCQMQFVDNMNIDLPFCVHERRGVHKMLELVEDGELYEDGMAMHRKIPEFKEDCCGRPMDISLDDESGMAGTCRACGKSEGIAGPPPYWSPP